MALFLFSHHLAHKSPIIYWDAALLELILHLYFFFSSFLFKNFICLTKWLYWLDWKLKQYVWQNFFFEELFKTSSNFQEPIRHIHSFQYMFCKTMKFCRFHKFLFQALYFEFYSLNVSNFFYLIIHLYIHNDILLQQHFYLRFFSFFIFIVVYKLFNQGASIFIFHFSND